ncbi:hypothetical protein B0J13DRAFT_529479 [Dactylonectria estremocensis]|uniref:Uncharacterized protein n=1 Tax=Dactylonectria estremocensis TaxID=1079267 RepID=A0A9P9E4W2_9HYPO|nr:hypothetical protein B0J13DRAFT_529479 [Dactylonectria estremocensis]
MTILGAALPTALCASGGPLELCNIAPGAAGLAVAAANTNAMPMTKGYDRTLMPPPYPQPVPAPPPTHACLSNPSNPSNPSLASDAIHQKVVTPAIQPRAKKRKSEKPASTNTSYYLLSPGPDKTQNLGSVPSASSQHI